MITVDREKARAYINEILDDEEGQIVTEDELDVFISMIVEPSEELIEQFMCWLDHVRREQ